MHQIRNLFLNILTMILSVSAIPFIITKIWGKPYDLPHVIIICVFLVIMSIVLSFFSFDTDTTIYYKFPPSNIVTIIYFGIHALCGNIKIIKTVDYKFFCRYSNGRIYVYEFQWCTYAKIISMDYEDSNFTTNAIRTRLYKRLEIPLSHDKKSKDFKSWTGALDEESKRISTIKNIID